MEFVQFDPLPIGSPQHHQRGPDILEPDQLPNSRPCDARLPLELVAQLDEERLHGFKIVDNDEDVIKAFESRPFGSLGSMQIVGVTTCRLTTDEVQGPFVVPAKIHARNLV